MRIDLVVLDMAGTTVYDGDAVHRSLADALRAAAVEVTREAINAVMGMPKPQAIARLLEGRGRPDVASAAVHADFVERMVAFYRTDPAVRETEGASRVFRRLRAAGIKVALDTGFDRRITDVILARLGWSVGAGFDASVIDASVIDASVTSDEVGRGRPHADLILRAMERTGVSDAQRVAKVGDTPADLEEGFAAGCALVIGVTSGSHTRAELERCRHTHLIERLDELPALVGA